MKYNAAENINCTGSRGKTHLHRRWAQIFSRIIRSSFPDQPCLAHRRLGIRVQSKHLLPANRIRKRVEGSFISSFNLPMRKRTNNNTRRRQHSLLPIGTRRPTVRHAGHQDGFFPLPVSPRFPLFCGHHTQAAHVGVVVVTEFIPRRRSVLPLHR